LCLPILVKSRLSDLSQVSGKNLKFSALSSNPYLGFFHKAYFPIWFIKNIGTLIREIKKSSIVHCILPGSVGFLGFVMMILLRKKGFLRYCGNWNSPKSIFNKLTIKLIKKKSSENIISFITGASDLPPYEQNKYISWIHSTTLDIVRMKKYNKLENPVLKDDINILHVGRQETYKGTHLIINAVEKLQHTLPQISLSIVGDGNEIENLCKMVDDKKLNDKVKFYGQVNNKDLIKFYERAAIFCFPSKSEGFPKVIVEAMASGTPIICSNIPVLRYLINDSNGYILESLDSDNLVNGIKSIIADKNRYMTLSKKIKKDVQNLTLEKFSQKISENINNLS
jgi:glycosyltransferase involved in cell wall biosynthesis